MSPRRYRRALVAASLTVCVVCAFVVLPSGAIATPGPPVTFPDAALDSAVRAAINKPSPNQIYASDLATLTTLTARDAGIAHLDGLEWCTHLEELNLGSNNIATITPLAGLTELTQLLVDNNQIEDIEPVAGLSHLRSLYVNHNDITDVSPLSGLHSLGTVYLGQNSSLTTVAPLAGLTDLASLDLGYVPVADLPSISGLTNLVMLDLYDDTTIRDISPLAGMTRLQWLNISQNQVTTLTPVAGMTDLRFLRADNNQITTITAVQNLTKLTNLGLGNNNISDISPLHALVKLDTLALSHNQIRDLSPLAGLTHLRLLYLQSNQLWDISPIASLNASGGSGDANLTYNWLDLTPGCPTSVIASGLAARGYKVAVVPQYAAGSIVGTVTVTPGGSPTGVRMTLGCGPYATTLANGSYALHACPTGVQTLTFSKPHYTSCVATLSVNSGTTYSVNATLSAVLSKPTLKRSPSSSSLTYKRKKGTARFTLAATVIDTFGPVSGTWVWLQKSTNGKKWTTLYRLKTNSAGNISKAFSAKKKGTTYYRWYAPGTILDRAAVTGRQKVRIR